MWEGCYTDYILHQQQIPKTTCLSLSCGTGVHHCVSLLATADDQMIANICQNHHEILKITEMSGWCYHIVKHPPGISDLGDDGIQQLYKGRRN